MFKIPHINLELYECPKIEDLCEDKNLLSCEKWVSHKILKERYFSPSLNIKKGSKKLPSKLDCSKEEVYFFAQFLKYTAENAFGNYSHLRGGGVLHSFHLKKDFRNEH